MKYVSTKNTTVCRSFGDAVFQGLAPDGGLFVPREFPHLHTDTVSSQQSLSDIAIQVLSPFLADEIPPSTLKSILEDTLSFPLPIRNIAGKYVLELFHGPTMAFKDVAAQILPRFMEYFLKKEKKEITVLTATSGDTGGAVAHGFGGSDQMNVFILFPKGRVSKLQHDQLTRVAENVYPIEIDGTFDDCQQVVKHAFTDPELANFNLTSANSINIGRLLPQMIYYAYAVSLLKQSGKKIRFTVPSGNMGNVTAGLYAKKIGLPIDSFLIASNANDSVVKYFQSGIYTPQETIQTVSTAMDIGDPSNFERILHLYKNDMTQLRKDIRAVSISDQETIETIKCVYTDHNYLLDPHTAVAWSASEKVPFDGVDVVISTAHPAKFASEIKKNTGIEMESLNIQSQYSSRKFKSKPDFESVKKIILSM